MDGEEVWNVVVLHGAHGGPDTNWFPWLSDELAASRVNVVRPCFPTPEGQSLGTWLEAFDQVLADVEPRRTVLVGHSLGAAFALRVVERSSQAFVGTFLVAGFVGALGLPDYDPINSSFFAAPFDWAALRARVGDCRCWAGDDDPYVPLDRSREMADRLGAPLEVVPGGGHLNAEVGMREFPALRDRIRALLAPVDAADPSARI